MREEATGGELVLGVTIEKEARDYPINMLTGPSHETINDTLGGTAIAAYGFASRASPAPAAR